MQYDVVEYGDALYLYSETTGFIRAYAEETKGPYQGLAYLKVSLNSAALPGISEMTVNTNTFDVWKADNPEVLTKIAETYIKPEYTR